MTEKLKRIEDALWGLEEEITLAKSGVLGTDVAGLRSRGGAKDWLDSATGKSFRRDPIPVASISRPLADQLLRRANADVGLNEIEQTINETWRPRSFAIPNTQATLSVNMTPASRPTSNVVAVLPGRGELANESVVIGAHYDHVGMGGVGSLAPGTIAVHNGADDNASGTATLLQIADRLPAMLANQSSHRRIVFIAFTAEERGLLGSKHYVDQPRFPLRNTVAMINMDMVGRLRDNELTVYGTGSASGLNEILDRANATTDFRLFRVDSGYGPSDHTSFFEKGIPVLFFFTGLHQDYHRPSDDFEKLNLVGMARITDMVSQVSDQLATMSQRPTYASTTTKFAIRRQRTVFMGVSMSEGGGGVMVSNVAAESPAQEAELAIGDRLVQLAQQPIERIDQVMDLLRTRSPGDELSVIIDRNGQALQKTLKLRAR